MSNTNPLEQLNQFLNKYSKRKSLNFSKTEIFPGTKILQPFGIFLDKDQISFSSKTSFGKAETFLYDVIAPFDFERVEYLEELDLIVLHSNFGFSFRIYNVSFASITQEFSNALDNGTILKRNMKICKCGEVKYHSPFKAHIEIYAESYSVFSSILSMRFPTTYLKPYDMDMIIQFLNIFCIDHEKGIKELKELKEKESIKLMNPFLCIKKDKLLDKELIFYSFSALF